jgi:mycothiol synthase
VDLASGARALIAIDEDAVAIVSETEAELVVDPPSRGRGLGAALAQRVARPGLLVWAHGDLPAARSLAARFGAEPVRRLLQLEAPVAVRPGPEFDTFRVGVDEAEWVALNARVFSFHPEQGSVSVDDVLALEREEWFDASAFLVARAGGVMTGYCWLKIADGEGEVYVLGTDRRGTGEGAALLDAGLRLLVERGIRTVSLYVEGDNGPALRLYRERGFTQRSIDVQYRLP